MRKWFKRIWFRMTHKHDWVEIYKASGTCWPSGIDLDTAEKLRLNRKMYYILERCYCGKERGWILKTDRHTHDPVRTLVPGQQIRDKLFLDLGEEVPDFITRHD